MVKTNAEKQKEYIERVKAKNSDLAKKRQGKKKSKELLKKFPAQHKRKDRERKAAKKAA